MTSRAIIIALSLSAMLLVTLAIWPKPKIDEEPNESSIPHPDEAIIEPTVSIVKPGDSLFAWNDSSLFFDFITIMDSSDIPEPVIDVNHQSAHSERFPVTWSMLQDVMYGRSYFESIEMEVYVPLFPRKLLEIEGRNVTIEGYVIPIDGSQESLALSASPFAACFFCGKGSPASVVSLYFDGPKKNYVIDDFVQFEGRLRLNADNPEEFYYYLEDTEEITQNN